MDSHRATPSRVPLPAVIATLCVLAAVLGYFMLDGSETAAPQESISSGSTAPAPESVEDTIDGSTIPNESAAPALIAVLPQPTPTPLPLVDTQPTPEPTTEADTDQAAEDPSDSSSSDTSADDTSSDDTSSSDTSAEDTTTDATATAVPEPTATVSAEPTATAAVPEPTATVTAEPTATAEPQTEAAPEPTTGPTPAPTTAPAQIEQIELPAFSSGGSFTHVLFAKPTTARVRIYDEPGGQELQVTYEYLSGDTVINDLVNPTHFGNTLSLRVVRGAPGDEWAMVELPTRPNGQTAWVQTSPYDWGSSNHLVRINVGTNTVTIWEGDQLLLETAAVTGTSNTPTPLLTGYVDEKVYGLGGAYGPVLLSLGVFSNALNTFGANGEAPKIALHGTNAPQLMGQYASNGCIRVPNEIIQQISEMVPVGSRVEIVG